MIRAVIATLTLQMFVIRLLLAAIPMTSPAAGPGAQLVPICTAEGLKWVDLDEQGPAPPAAMDKCPLCLAGLGLVALLPAAEALRRVVTFAAALPVFARQAPALRIAARPPPVRGPPLLSKRETLVRSF